VVWADTACVEATVQGFLNGLATQEKEGRIPPGMQASFFSHYGKVGRQGIGERVRALVNACDSRAPDMPVIRDNLGNHIAELISALNRVGGLNPKKANRQASD
jgi:hypothetical protein